MTIRGLGRSTPGGTPDDGADDESIPVGSTMTEGVSAEAPFEL